MCLVFVYVCAAPARMYFVDCKYMCILCVVCLNAHVCAEYDVYDVCMHIVGLHDTYRSFLSDASCKEMMTCVCGSSGSTGVCVCVVCPPVHNLHTLVGQCMRAYTFGKHRYVRGQDSPSEERLGKQAALPRWRWLRLDSWH